MNRSLSFKPLISSCLSTTLGVKSGTIGILSLLKTSSFILCIVALILAITCGSCTASNVAVDIAGKITDNEDNPISGASVKIDIMDLWNNKVASDTVTTRSNGRYIKQFDYDSIQNQEL